MFKDVIIRKIDSHKGAPRLYLDMGLLGRANFGSGQQYQVSVDSESRRVTLEINEAGARVVSGKKKENNYVPVIDLNSIKVLGVFAGLDRVRIILSVGKIFILPLTSDMAQLERLSRVVAKLSSGECLTTASFCHGAGLMAHAAHEGLASGGVNTKAALVNEIDEEYIGQSMGHNPMWSEGTRALVVP